MRSGAVPPAATERSSAEARRKPYTLAGSLSPPAEPPYLVCRIRWCVGASSPLIGPLDTCTRDLGSFPNENNKS